MDAVDAAWRRIGARAGEMFRQVWGGESHSALVPSYPAPGSVVAHYTPPLFT